MGILQLYNQTPTEWYSKKQSTVKTTTFGTDFVTARHGVNMTIDTAFVLHSFGIPVEEPTWMIGYMSSTIPHSLLKKQWVALSYHHVCMAIAHGVV